MTNEGHVERELKLDADPDFDLPDMAADVPGASVRRRPPVELDATYYDGADRRLLAAGVTVRRRTGEGTRWTVKTPAPPTPADRSGVTLDRREVDVWDEASEPPAEVRQLVGAWLGDGELVAVARLVSSRSRLDLILAGPDRVVAEVDDDLVVVHDGSREVGRFREIEIELAGDLSESEAALAAPVVDAVVARLIAAGARRDTMRPKVDRALAMIDGPWEGAS